MYCFLFLSTRLLKDLSLALKLKLLSPLSRDSINHMKEIDTEEKTVVLITTLLTNDKR